MLCGRGKFYWQPLALFMSLFFNANCPNAKATPNTFNVYADKKSEAGKGIEVKPENIPMMFLDLEVPAFFRKQMVKQGWETFTPTQLFDFIAMNNATSEDLP